MSTETKVVIQITVTEGSYNELLAYKAQRVINGFGKLNVLEVVNDFKDDLDRMIRGSKNLAKVEDALLLENQ